MGRIVGIDLGTTNSLIAAIVDGKPKVLSIGPSFFVPSIVGVRADGGLLVGDHAKSNAILNPERTIASAKRFIGRSYAEVSETKARSAVPVVETESQGIAFQIDELRITPEEVGAEILRRLIEEAEEQLGEEISDAVITVPAYFNNAQRKATEDAGSLAGINVRRILNEPTAAALAFGLNNREGGKVLVFDLGGGTFDVSLLEIGDKVWEVLATAGDNFLGGDDFDQAVVDWALDEATIQLGVNLKQHIQAYQRLKVAVEEAKRAISTVPSVNIDLPFILSDERGNHHLSMVLTREKFDALTAQLLERCREPFLTVLRDGKIDPEELDDILLVGGSTRIPAVRKLIKELSKDREPNSGVNPDEVVALGAAVQAGILAGQVEEMVLLDVTPFSLGVLTGENDVTRIIPRNTSVPCSRSEFFSTAEHFQRGVDIVILQGESSTAKKNRILGQFALEGIRKVIKGDALIEVTFSLNENGILNVTAKDQDTGHQSNVEIKTLGSLDRKTLEKMVSEKNEVASRTDKEYDDIFKKAEYWKERLANAFPEETATKVSRELLNALTAGLEKGLSKRKLKSLSAKAEELLAAKGTPVSPDNVTYREESK